MKKLLGFLFIIIFLSGCTYTATSETGSSIDQDKVLLIQKGKTTEQQIKAMFGEPMTKIVINDTDTKWIYQHIVSTASSQMYTGKTSQALSNDILDILFRNGVVVNFSNTNSTSSPTMNVRSSW
ncbi:hypothetical protein RHO14_03420 [Orbus wheelerorum]|uniref:hypothetical protein n=1 Tax=Orbus wheelerorum TaxID=3074111 RepID=UPI00370CFF69